MLVLALGGAIVGCRRTPTRKALESKVDATLLRIRVFEFEHTHVGKQQVVVLIPRWAPPGGKFPLLIALHGRGEAHRGVAAGAWGWTKDYHLDRAFLRARKGKLDQEDLAGVATASYLTSLNHRLHAHPFAGLIVACPFTPDIMTSGKLQDAASFASFLKDNLIPKIDKELAGLVDLNRIGIDGVSLGGRVALLSSGFLPSRFLAVGTLQAAFRQSETSDLVRWLTERWRNERRPKHVRLLTSTQDPFRPVLHDLRQKLGAQGIETEWSLVPGPHDYVFNQGPGAYELLLWHDRVLRQP